MNIEAITLTMNEQNKIQTISKWSEGRLELSRTREILNCSRRTLFRWKALLLQQGPKAFVHGNRGRRSPKKIPDKTVVRILKLRQDVYENTNDTHFKELLALRESIVIGRSTLQRLLRCHGVAPKQKRRPVKFRTRRERKASFGAMLQLDASHHQWFGPMGTRLALHGAIDDATNMVWAHFEETETTHGYFELMRSVLSSHGIPLSVYTDRHAIFHPVTQKICAEEERQGKKSMSQFGRAMSELGITLIPAQSPQAKGRIERLWHTFQDRLVVEMRLAGICTKAAAQIFLKGYLARFNKQFGKNARSVDSLFRKTPSQRILDDTLCRKEFRVVQNDHTVSYQGRILQIPKPKGWRTLAKKSVEIWDRSDGVIKIVYQNKIITTYQPPTKEMIFNLAA